MRLLGGLLFIFFLQSSWAKETVRVRLLTFTKTAHVSGLGVSARVNSHHYKNVAIPRFETFNILLQQLQPVVKWNFQGEVIYGGPLKLEGHLLRVNLTQMPKVVYLYPRLNKKIDVIAEFDLEDYLMGVLPNEMPAHWPLEALKAQAIVARSYALSMVANRKNKKGYHLEKNIFDQVFRRSKLQSITPYQKNKLLTAIRSTQGQLLVNQKSKPIKAHYHADCGGSTEAAMYVWQGSKSYGVTADKYCPQSPRANWSYLISKRKLARRLFNVDSLVENVNVLSKTLSKRNWLVSFSMHGLGDDMVLNSQEVRRRLGFMNLRSTRFKVVNQGTDILFVGTGFGHGVGMCQWGAKAHAMNGKNYQQILNHYYPKAQLNINTNIPEWNSDRRLAKDKNTTSPLKL